MSIKSAEDAALRLQVKERAAFLHLRKISDNELMRIAATTADPAELIAINHELIRRFRATLREGRSHNVLPLHKKKKSSPPRA
jgi:hypothetical protein